MTKTQGSRRRSGRTLFSLRYALDEIGSLGPVIDPPKATEERGEALAELERARVEALCVPDVGDVLERLAAVPELLSETQRAQVRVLTRDRDALVRIPADEQAAFSRLTREAEDVWRRRSAGRPAPRWSGPAWRRAVGPPSASCSSAGPPCPSS